MIALGNISMLGKLYQYAWSLGRTNRGSTYSKSIITRIYPVSANVAGNVVSEVGIELVEGNG